MSSKSDAYDDEMEAFEKSKTDYLENLRESIKDTDKVIEQTYQNVLTNGQTVLETLTDLSNEYGFYIDKYLTSPWENAQNESLDFETNAMSHIDNIYDKVNSITSTLTANITQPWKDGKRDLLSFSEEVKDQLDIVLEEAKNNQTEILNTTSNFVGNMKGKIDLIPTYADNAAKRMLEIAKQNVRDINAEYAKIQYPSYTGGDTGGGGGNNTIDPPAQTKKYRASLYGTLNLYDPVTGKKIKSFTKNGTSSKQYESKSEALSSAKSNATARIMDDFISYRKSKGDTASEATRSWESGKYKNLITWASISYYKKGTLGTQENQYAITDEIGDELVLIPGKNGNLQYMRKGTAVMPADISANLVEWGKLNPNMMDMSSMTSGINLMSNVINKPELNLSFDSLLHIDNCSNEVIPEVKKIVNEQLDKFARQLNYSLKRVGG